MSAPASDRIISTISSPRYGWHCTTAKKLERYRASGRIIAPVRFWPSRECAERWQRHTGRELILKIRLDHISYPLPDHKPALWCPEDVVEYEIIDSTVTHSADHARSQPCRRST